MNRDIGSCVQTSRRFVGSADSADKVLICFALFSETSFIRVPCSLWLRLCVVEQLQFSFRNEHTSAGRPAVRCARSVAPTLLARSRRPMVARHVYCFAFCHRSRTGSTLNRFEGFEENKCTKFLVTLFCACMYTLLLNGWLNNILVKPAACDRLIEGRGPDALKRVSVPFVRKVLRINERHQATYRM